MATKLKHILSVNQFTRELLEEDFFKRIPRMQEIVEKKGSETLKKRRIIELFYEPSTRTRFSFELAISFLGGEFFHSENAEEFSSGAKGESIKDTVRVLCQYNIDAIIIRNKVNEAPMRGAEVSTVPIINAGDGTNEHPTQALLDIYTIFEHHKRIDELKIALVGDLKNGRTARSLALLMSLFENINLYLVAPDGLEMPKVTKTQLKEKKVKVIETPKLEEVMDKVDVVYMTRPQLERGTKSDGGKEYQFQPNYLETLKENAIIMHPLPRMEELPTQLDNDRRSVYLTKQVHNGLIVRMGILEYLLQDS